MTVTSYGPVSTYAQGSRELAEGARWVDGRLVFTDILAGALLEITGEQPRTARSLARLDMPLGAVAPVSGQPGCWIVAAGTGIAMLSSGGQLHWLGQPEQDAPVPARMNDGCCDPRGRFWAGSMPYDGTPGAGSLYRTDHDGSVHRVLSGLTIVNGPAFTPDGSRLYLADTAARIIYRYAVSLAGELAGPATFQQLPAASGAPDGMTVDSDGCLWVALWGGAAVHRYDPGGTLIARIQLPTPQPTSVCLTPSGDQLLITTARYGLAQPSAPSGAILSVPVPASAREASAYQPRFIDR